MDESLQQAAPMAIKTFSLPSTDRMFGAIKGPRGCMEPPALRTRLDDLPDHAHRGFQAFHKGRRRLGKRARTALTCVNDTAIMMFRRIGRVILQVGRWAFRAPAL
jgi:hypothetical protein